VLSVAALVSLVELSVMGEDPWRIVTVTLFGSTLLLTYVFSTLYHAVPHPKAKRFFRTCDLCAIYLLIAGTYTPFLLVNMRGPWGWSLFGLLWGLAALGCIYRLFFCRGTQYGWRNFVSTGIYLGMGWVALVAFKPGLEMIPMGAIILLVIGGVAYTSGTIFYLWERLPYNHAIWHVFVLGGSTAHFFAVLFFVVPLGGGGGGGA
jgi:hemolysin III